MRIGSHGNTPKVLNNLADIKSAGGVALRVRTQAPATNPVPALVGAEANWVSLDFDCSQQASAGRPKLRKTAHRPLREIAIMDRIER
jgi:hypothetical protein